MTDATNNRYAVYKTSDDQYFLNCIDYVYCSDRKVGDAVNGATVVHIGPLDECEQIVASHAPTDGERQRAADEMFGGQPQ